jgi:hypothetical protein
VKLVRGLLLEAEDLKVLTPAVVRAARLLHDTDLARLAAVMAVVAVDADSEADVTTADMPRMLPLKEYARLTGTPESTARYRARMRLLEGATKEGGRCSYRHDSRTFR